MIVDFSWVSHAYANWDIKVVFVRVETGLQIGKLIFLDFSSIVRLFYKFFPRVYEPDHCFVHSLFTLTFNRFPRFWFSILLFSFSIIIPIKKDWDRLCQFSRHSSNYEIFLKVVFLFNECSILYFCCFEKQLDYTSRYPIIVNVYHEFNLFQNKNFHFALSPIGFKTQFSISSLSTSKRSKHKSTMSVSASKRPTHRRIAILLRCIVATLHKALSMLLIRYRSSGWSWKISNQFQEFQATWCNDSHQLSNFR